MLFNIAPQNAEKAKRAFTAARPAHVYGYTASAILTPKNPRMIFSYQIDQIHDIIVCTIRHQEAETVEAVITARAFTDTSIEIERAELYRNASNYPYRTETNDRYMRKYDQIACIIHGAISAGLLFDVSENQEEHTEPQETTGATTAHDTTCTDREPQRATEDAQTESRHKYGMRLRGYSIGAQPAGVVERADDPTGLYYDIITYNRELTPEELDMYSLTPLEAPTAPETVTGKEDTTTDGNEAQEATETAMATANDTTPAADQEKPENAHRRTEAAEAVQDTTCTQTEPPRATDAATTGAGEQTTTAAAPTPSGDRSTANKMTAERSERRKRYLQRMIDELARKRRKARRDAKEMTTGRTTPPRHACENAPGRTERATPGQAHATHAKRPPRAAQRATTHGRPRGYPEKTANFGRFYPLLDFSRTIFANFQGIPISVCIFGPVFDPEFWRQKRHPPGGYKNLTCMAT